jgi:hypothetical protein
VKKFCAAGVVSGCLDRDIGAAFGCIDIFGIIIVSIFNYQSAVVFSEVSSNSDIGADWIDNNYSAIVINISISIIR